MPPYREAFILRIMRGGKMKLFKVIKKADILLLILLLLLGCGSLFLVNYSSEAGENAVISVDGQVYGTYPLSQNRQIDVNTEYGFNQVIIENGSVRVEESDCLNHECEAFGHISTPRQTIICLPHRLIITVTGQSDVDVVVY